VRALFFRRCRPGRRAATAALLILATCAWLCRSSFASEAAPKPSVAPPAKADDGVALPCAIFGGNRAFALTPPVLLADPHLAGGPSNLHQQHLSAPNPTARSLRLPEPAGPVLRGLDLSLRYLRLAVHGDYREGLWPFLGTSTASLGGLRLRF
jgi:hypothetical protein